MKRVIRIVLGVLAGLALVMSRWWAPQVEACSCNTPGDPIQAADASSAVFVGKVVMLDRGKDNLIATLQVNKRWKGDLDPQLTVYTPLSEASCGFTFEKGKDYLVYATKKDGVLQVSFCSRTKLLSEAKADLDALNKRVWMMGGTEQPADTPVSSEPNQNPNTKPSSNPNGNQAAPTNPEVKQEGNTTGWMVGGAVILLAVIGGYAFSKSKKK